MTYALLANPAKAGIYFCPAQNWPGLAEAAAARGMQIQQVVLPKGGTLGGLLRQTALDLQFPAWFGNNLDALHDALTDPEWHHNRPQLIHLAGGTSPLSENDLDDLLNVLHSAVELRRETTSPLWIVTGFESVQIPKIPA